MTSVARRSELGRLTLALGLAVTLLLASAHVRAQEDTLAQARTYFNMGAQAYAKGDYVAAVQAFEEAFRRSPRPGIMFSAAQAYRRQYYIDKKPANLKRAVEYYRQYLAKEQKGNRRGDVAEALAELEPLLARAEAEGVAMTAPAMEAKPATRLMISSPTSGATIAFDGGSAQSLPFISEVKPGKHRFEVEAQGFRNYSREISVPEGGVIALDVPLEEEPSRLTVAAAGGATIFIDGRPAGETPLGAISLAPGRHFVAVTKNGRRGFSKELELKRGESRSVSADLPTTGQRMASWILLGTAGGALVTGGILTYLGVQQENDAEAVLSARARGNLDEAALDDYENAKAARDDLRTGSIVAYGAGLALAATGLVLFVFDEPRVGPPPMLPERTRPEQKPVAPASMEISAAPFWEPGRGGAAVRGRF